MHPRSCPLCASARKRCLYTDRNRRDAIDVTASYVACLDCGMVYLDPTPDLTTFDGWDEVFAGSAGPPPSSSL